MSTQEFKSLSVQLFWVPCSAPDVFFLACEKTRQSDVVDHQKKRQRSIGGTPIGMLEKTGVLEGRESGRGVYSQDQHNHIGIFQPRSDVILRLAGHY